MADRLDAPSHWGDLLFNEWLDGTEHCNSHFRPFVEIDVFYWSADTFRPSPWLKWPAAILLDPTGIITQVLQESADLRFPTASAADISRVMSKALAGLHAIVRRIRRGELAFAQSLLEERRSNMIRLDDCLQGFVPVKPGDLRVGPRISGPLLAALKASYTSLEPSALEAAAVTLADVLMQQISQLHGAFALGRSLDNDSHAAALVKDGEIP